MRKFRPEVDLGKKGKQKASKSFNWENRRRNGGVNIKFYNEKGEENEEIIGPFTKNKNKNSRQISQSVNPSMITRSRQTSISRSSDHEIDLSLSLQLKAKEGARKARKSDISGYFSNAKYPVRPKRKKQVARKSNLGLPPSKKSTEFDGDDEEMLKKIVKDGHHRSNKARKSGSNLNRKTQNLKVGGSGRSQHLSFSGGVGAARKSGKYKTKKTEMAQLNRQLRKSWETNGTFTSVLSDYM